MVKSANGPLSHTHIFIGSTIIDMHAKCSNLKQTNKVFDVSPNGIAGSWHAMSAAYFQPRVSDPALNLSDKILLEDFRRDKITFLSILKTCGKDGALEQGKQIHEHIIRHGLESDVVIGSALINMYAKCGNMEIAHKVFDKLPHRNVVSWGAIISGYVQHGQGVLALDLFEKMHDEGTKPDRVMFSCILKACGSICAIDRGKQIHDQVLKSGFNSDVVIGSTLIDMYAKCGCLEEARKVFDELPSRNVVSWASMISGYAQYGFGFPALELYGKMQCEGTKPDSVTFLCLLKACGSIFAIKQGMLLQDQIIRSGLEANVVMGSTLIDMYSKCGNLKEAWKVFSGLPKRTVVSWNVMISGYVLHGFDFLALDLFEKMQQEGIKPAKVTFLSILKACGSIGAIQQGRLIHNQLSMSGLESDLTIGNTLIDMYAKCGNLEEAQKVFDDLPKRDAVSWGAMITGCVQHGHGLLALKLFEKMQQHGIKPDKVSFSSTLKACGSTGAIMQGKLIHAQIKNSGYETDVVIGNSLIDMYAKCGNLEEARKVFDKLLNRSVVSWGAMVAGYAQHGMASSALELFDKMQQEGVKPGNVTFSCALKACSIIKATEHAKQIHDQLVKNGFESDVIIGNALVDMYVNFGCLEDAHKVFDKLPDRDVVSWSTMIAGYADDGHGFPALDLFTKMQQEGIIPDRVLFFCVLKACGSIGAIGMGKVTHDQVVADGHEQDLAIGNTLIDMYAKCGSLEGARKVFDKLMNRNVVSWNAMIAGYAQHGECKMAKECFEDMQSQGLKPDGWTYSSILTACSQAVLVEEGHGYFKTMKEEHGITPSIEHFNCLVDLLGRAGCLQEAEKILQTMPVLPDVTGWMSLLTACRTYGNIELGTQCFKEVIQLEPKTAAVYVLMSNIYTDFHMLEDVHKLQELKTYAGAWKKPGRACVETKNVAHEFIVGDEAHLQIDNVHTKLLRLARHIKEGGYMPKLEVGV